MAPLVIWFVTVSFMIWWAERWGRSMIWAMLGAIFLTPLVWAIVLLVMGRAEDEAMRKAIAKAREDARAGG
jgi:xanthine/uracil permease